MSLVAGAPSVVVEAELPSVSRMRSLIRLSSITAGAPSLSVGAELLSPSDRTGPLAKSITQGVATIKRLLLTGGALRSVEWHQPIGDKDVRGRQAVSISLLDALIEQRPELWIDLQSAPTVPIIRP